MVDRQVVTEVRATLQQFQEGYQVRNLENLDAFMTLFYDSEETELIGIGATVPSEHEWFRGLPAIREIIQSDWTYWGDVTFDVENATIQVVGEVAWFSATGFLTQTDSFNKAMPAYLEQMEAMLTGESLTSFDKLVEVTHFGVRRLWEYHKGAGHPWSLVLTGVLSKVEGKWYFRQIQFAMPVD